MGCFTWIVFGALAGWVANIIMGLRSRGCLTNVLIGVLGAFLGGVLFNLFTRQRIEIGWDLRSFAVAVIGAILLLVISGAGRRRA